MTDEREQWIEQFGIDGWQREQDRRRAERLARMRTADDDLELDATGLPDSGSN